MISDMFNSNSYISWGCLPAWSMKAWIPEFGTDINTAFVYLFLQFLEVKSSSTTWINITTS